MTDYLFRFDDLVAAEAALGTLFIDEDGFEKSTIPGRQVKLITRDAEWDHTDLENPVETTSEQTLSGIYYIKTNVPPSETGLCGILQDGVWVRMDLTTAEWESVLSISPWTAGGVETKHFPLGEYADAGDLYTLKTQAAQQALGYREAARQRARVILGEESYTLRITADNLAMLNMRAGMNTDGMWGDEHGELFYVEASQYQDIIVALVQHGDWVYGQYYTYKLRIAAAATEAELTTIISDMATAFAAYEAEV